MTSLTLKGLPDTLINRLRDRAKQERRSLNQQVIVLLEKALAEEQPDFKEAYTSFLHKHGPSPFDDESYHAIFEGLRSQELGRPLPFESEEDA